ncbi:Uncharacterised protein [uncultured Ruminococcus sp.]|nr:Uncharacterised protein [uncultured Ruminococcus sp.]
MAVFIFNLYEMRRIDDAVFIGKLRIFGIGKYHDLVRMIQAEWFVHLIVVQQLARRRFDNTVAGNADLDDRFDIDSLGIIRQHDFIVIREHLAFAQGSRFNKGQVISTKHHILRRYGNRLAVLRRQNVVCRKHERSRFSLGFYGQGQMAGHLVAVEVGVEGGADQRMQLNGPAFPKNRFEGLNT